MEGNHQIRIDIFRVLRQRDGFPLVQGRTSHIIPGTGLCESLRKLDFPGAEPSGGILEIQIHPQQVGFPAVRERNGRIVVRQRLGCFVFQCAFFDGAGDQIHPIGIDHGHGIDGGCFQNILRGHTENSCVRFRCLRQLLQKFQKYRGSNPLVGMVCCGIEYLPVTLADDQRQYGSAESGRCQAFGLKRGIPPYKRSNDSLAQGGGHGNVGLHNSQNITSR